MSVSLTNLERIKEALQDRATRIEFTNYVWENYGVNKKSTYRRIILMRFDEWELRGLLHCVREFAGDKTITDVYQWYESLPQQKTLQAETDHRRMMWYAYMRPNGLDRETMKKHMDAHDWTKIQIEGWGSAWYQFVKARNKK